MLVLDQREEDESATQNAQDVTQQERMKTFKIAQLKSLLTTDSTVATDVVTKVQQIVDSDDTNEALASQVDSYTESLFELDEKISSSWRDIVSLHTTVAELEEVTAELQITQIRSSIQDTRSKCAAFIQKCRPKVPSTPAVSDTASETSETSSSHDKFKDKMLRPRTIGYPVFKGELRNFARFQRDFEKIVTPHFPDDS